MLSIVTINAANYTIFSNADAARDVVKDWDAKSYRINIDPKGSGRCFIEILDEETGEVLGKL